MCIFVSPNDKTNTMNTYLITYLDYTGAEKTIEETSSASSNFVRDEFIENFTESTFVKIVKL